MREDLSLYEQQLANLYCPVEFRKYFAFVPSFLELYPLHFSKIYFLIKKLKACTVFLSNSLTNVVL